MPVPFLEENDQTRARQEHLEALRQLVGNAYPNKFERSHIVDPQREDTITKLVEKYRAFEPEAAEGERPAPEAIELANQQLNQVTVRIAGRIASPPRVMGKAAFVHLSDGVTRIQIYVKRADVKGVSNDAAPGEVDGWELFNLLDHGDFIGVEGYLFITKTGELSIHVQKLKFLSKALLPMPDKMHGVSDPEIKRRQRYVDLIAGSLRVKLEEEEEEEDETERNKLESLTPRQVFQRRSAVVRELRRFLDDNGYIEVETPMLTPKATGAVARPFETFHNALGIKLYARIAPELYLKRLVVGGFEKVYELNRNFRNEGISYKHNPEFTMLEIYTAYMDVNGMMDLCEELLGQSVLKATGKSIAKYVVLEREEVVSKSEDLTGTYSLGDLIIRPIYKTIELDFSKPFDRMTMKDAIAKYLPPRFAKLGDEAFDIDWLDDPNRVRELTRFFDAYDDEEASIKRLTGDKIQRGMDEADAVDEEQEAIEAIDIGDLWFQTVAASPPSIQKPTPAETAMEIQRLFGDFAENQLVPPTFITDFPKPISPLSKASPNDPTIAERFELFITGMECANGFSELNDPAEQYQRFMDQMSQRERGDEEAMVMDEDYIRALSYGMPPAAGIGIGIDRFVMLLTNKQSIRDVILFPHMRPERKPREQEEGKDEEEGKDKEE